MMENKRSGERPDLGISGGAERDRTVGLLNAIQALSQLSYSPFIDKFISKFNTQREKLSIHFMSFILLTYELVFFILMAVPEW